MFSFLGKVLKKVLGGSRNERIGRSRLKVVAEQVNPHESEMRALSDAQLLAKSAELKRRRSEGESRRSIMPEAFAIVREASRRARDHRQFDVQLVAGMILDEGWIAEEATGEGKTIACYPAIYMAHLEGMKAHVITVNDYLVERDAEFATPVFELLGMTVGFITGETETAPRKAAYACDVTYGTNSEFGFDYLRDNMKLTVEDQVQGSLDFAIIDEVDSVLIDEARTPLIISGPAVGQTQKFAKADAVAREVIKRQQPWDQLNKRAETLERDLAGLRGERGKAKGEEGESLQTKLDEMEAELARTEVERDDTEKFFEVELEKKSVHMTHEGVGLAQDVAGVGSFYVGANMEWPHLMDQALRAHLTFEKDVDYVLQQDQVVIVDQFTGRLQEGREWSDGLHQAVDAKERVRIKEENQTLATVTLQNFFKLYKKLAGMTGTAMTEAEEFMKIYKLDAAAVTTHRPVNRVDHNDRIYSEVDAKLDAIVEEVQAVSKAGRPVLVGTTSVEKSETLSNMLTRRYGIRHEVLNARPENARREADIVRQAGHQVPLKQGSSEMVGNVTIATNMAGRGTDIKLGPVVVYETCRVPADDELRKMGLEPEFLFPAGVNKCCIHCEQYDPATSCAHCFKPKLADDFPLRGRTDCTAEVPCGLHIVGTERHEARRIDNQLRGRSGRQGDPGSSRFFLSLRDDLMSIFAGEWAVRVLGWLGLQGDMAIEDRRISNGIERAQRKVEERNFDIRKHLLETDEVMDFQRRGYYSQRQRILEGRDLEGLVMEMLGDSIEQAVADYLEGDYVARTIAEWARQNIQLNVSPEQISAKEPADLPGLEDDLRRWAKDEVLEDTSVTLGEYMSVDVEPGEWDLRGLSGWAMSRFEVNISQNQLRDMTPDQVEQQLTESAFERIDAFEFGELGKFLQEGYARESLAEWARFKFTVDVNADELNTHAEEVTELLQAKVREAYQRQEVTYPVEDVLEQTVVQHGSENVYALGTLIDWANRKFDRAYTVEDLRGKRVRELRELLVADADEARREDVLRARIVTAIGAEPTVDAAIEFAREAFATALTADDFDGDVIDMVTKAGWKFLRWEMTELERYVLLQIYDSSWKDHLWMMDHLRDGIRLRAYAERDPRVEYKREGGRMYYAMMDGIREKVTDMIFKVRLAGQRQVNSVFEISNMAHEAMSAYDGVARDAAAQQQAAQPKKVETIKRDVAKVGRNDPCPCGSGKKYKKCCGATG